MKRTILLSEDGSHTIFVPELNEHYHSIHGAIQESMHVFIAAGLNHIPKEKIKILEIGFGTGLNAFLSYLHKKQNQTIDYFGIEKYPLQKEEYLLLNYAESLGESQQTFLKLHECEWNKRIECLAGFHLHKIENDIKLVSISEKVDLIYFDAFGPEIQSSMWEQAIFDKCYAMLNSNGILVTYSAKGIVRRRMIQSGFQVERIPGPPGKREMLRAQKKE